MAFRDLMFRASVLMATRPASHDSKAWRISRYLHSVFAPVPHAVGGEPRPADLKGTVGGTDVYVARAAYDLRAVVPDNGEWLAGPFPLAVKRVAYESRYIGFGLRGRLIKVGPDFIVGRCPEQPPGVRVAEGLQSDDAAVQGYRREVHSASTE